MQKNTLKDLELTLFACAKDGCRLPIHMCSKSRRRPPIVVSPLPSSGFEIVSHLRPPTPRFLPVNSSPSKPRYLIFLSTQRQASFDQNNAAYIKKAGLPYCYWNRFFNAAEKAKSKNLIDMSVDISIFIYKLEATPILWYHGWEFHSSRNQQMQGT